MKIINVVLSFTEADAAAMAFVGMSPAQFVMETRKLWGQTIAHAHEAQAILPKRELVIGRADW